MAAPVYAPPPPPSLLGHKIPNRISHRLAAGGRGRLSSKLDIYSDNKRAPLLTTVYYTGEAATHGFSDEYMPPLPSKLRQHLEPNDGRSARSLQGGPQRFLEGLLGERHAHPGHETPVFRGVFSVQWMIGHGVTMVQSEASLKRGSGLLE